MGQWYCIISVESDVRNDRLIVCVGRGGGGDVTLHQSFI